MGKVVDLLKAMFADAGKPRRTVMVDNEAGRYSFYYDERGAPMLDYVVDGYKRMTYALTKEEDRRFVRDGAQYIEELHGELQARHVAESFPKFLEDGEQQQRVQRAIIKLAAGDTKLQKQLVRDAQIDHRWVLHLAGDIDAREPLMAGETGIDPVSGAVVAEEARLESSISREEFVQSPLFEDGFWLDRANGEYVAACKPLTIAGIALNPALTFDGGQLVAIHFEGQEAATLEAWLKRVAPKWETRVFAWGYFEFEREGVVMRIRSGQPTK